MDFQLLIVFILAFLFAFALYWEVLDYSKVNGICPIDDLPLEQRLEALRNLACYNYSNGVGWRAIYVATILVVLILWYAIGCILSWHQWLLVILVIFFVFYGIAGFHAYHYSRMLCSKARPDIGAM